MVDRSVWIGDLRDDRTEAVREPRALGLAVERVVVPDPVLVEVLRGARHEAAASRIERDLRRFDIVGIGGEASAVEAARCYRHLRRLGVTVRGGIDPPIGAFCIGHGCALLRHDRGDFAPMRRHLGPCCL